MNAPSGAQIHLVHNKNTPTAYTSNFLGGSGELGQDTIKNGVPFTKDEVIQLSFALESINGISIFYDLVSCDLDALKINDISYSS